MSYAGLPKQKKLTAAERNYWFLTSVSPWVLAWAAYELISGERRDALPWTLLIISVAALVAGITGLLVQKARRT